MQKKTELREILELVKGQKLTLVTYKSWKKNHSLTHFIKKLSQVSSIKHITHSSLRLDLDMIESYLKLIHHDHQYIISIGGGSIIDLAKILRSLNSIDKTHQYIIGKKSETIHISIPTTVGSGSEATRFATYYSDKKKSYSHLHNIPALYCHEITFLKSLERSSFYHSVLDGITQAIESIFSKGSNQISIANSIEAIQYYKGSQVFDTQDYCLNKLQLASYHAGKAINIAKTNIAHAISYYLTEHHNIPHGHAVFLSFPGLLKLIEYQSTLSKSINDKKLLLLNAFNLSSIHEIIQEVSLIGQQINLGKMSEYISYEEFFRYFSHAMVSNRGKNLDIELSTIPKTIISESFYGKLA